jgi:hypothetical protein
MAVREKQRRLRGDAVKGFHPIIRPFARIWRKIKDAGRAQQRETVRRHERTLDLRPWDLDHAALDALIARSG